MEATPFVAGIIALAIFFGGIGGYFIRRLIAKKQIDSVEAKTERLVLTAKSKSQELLLTAKEKAIKFIEEAKDEERKRQDSIDRLQKRLEERESKFDEKLFEFENKQQALQKKAKEIEEIRTKLTELQERQKARLEEISGLSTQDAQKLLVNQIEKDVAEQLLNRRRKLEAQSGEELAREAKLKLVQVMQRYAGSHSADLTTSTVSIPSDEMKGRIIGKEGRNIRVIEQLTGVDIIIDDTPMAITLSCFSPIRREVAKRALRELVEDGRIHPSRIEETITKAKQEIAVEITKAGEDMLYELGITGIDPKLTQILGRLKFRTSYGQNVLLHSKEVSVIASLLAEELGADVAVCKRGGLFHDIGKAVDHDVQGGHPEIGYNILKKFGMSEPICYQTIAHHEDTPKTIEGVIVKIADAVSGARPGARNDSTEKYLQRLEELEEVATSFNGVEKAYAIQAGREIRVFVRSEELDDLAAQKVAQDIAIRIEEDLKYPGEIKVNVLRETRFIEYAR